MYPYEILFGPKYVPTGGTYFGPEFFDKKGVHISARDFWGGPIYVPLQKKSKFFEFSKNL